ncbi:MAG: hypothetical protein J0M35_13760 [Candidatus Obscuribacter phosphatis]|uniref:Uncharacterized protein n=1 Tax=Candidatus Obscuribacter phosphatis TaxID=1906157 RepID=A0A8J7P9C4_9BACT|nr:hypothetical protein [Candidatus Obscuribacter phosphatis]
MVGEFPKDEGKDKGEKGAQKPENTGVTFVQAVEGQAPGVAPGFKTEPSKTLDPFYRPANGGQQPEGPRRASPYLGSDIDPVTGKPIEKPQGGGQQVPSFRDRHADKQVDPTKPYERYNPNNPNGVRTASNAELNARAIAEQKIMSIIERRGLHGDIARDPDMNIASMKGFGRAILPVGIAGLTGASTDLLFKGGNFAADKSVAVGNAMKGSESKVVQRAGTLAEAPGQFWNRYVTGSGDLVPTKVANEVAEAAATRTSMITAEEAALRAAATEEAKAAANLRLATLRGSIDGNTVAVARTTQGVWSADEIAKLEQIAAGQAKAAPRTTIAANLAEKAKPLEGLKNGVVGAMANYSLILADRSIAEKISGPKAASESWNTAQWLTPAALALGKTWPGRLGYAAASIGVSRAVDGVLPKAPDSWNAPTGVMNWSDAAAFGGSYAMAQRIPNPIGRVGVALAAVTASKVFHAFEDSSNGKIKPTFLDAKENTVKDSRERSYDTLTDMRDSYQKLSGLKEDYMFDLIRASKTEADARWNGRNSDGSPLLRTDQKLLYFRQDAVMRNALGAEHLEQGTRIIDKSKVDYILRGYNLDLNGTASDLLLKSAFSSDKAASYTLGIVENNKDPNRPKVMVEGTAPTEQEAQDLKKFSDETRKKVNEVLHGEHDIPGAIRDLAKFTGANTDDVLKSIIKESDSKLLEYADIGKKAQQAKLEAEQKGVAPVVEMTSQHQQDATAMLAKLYRDQAVAYLAMAKNKLEKGSDGGGAEKLLFDEAVPQGQRDMIIDRNGRAVGQRNYNGAQGALRMAAYFGGGWDNPDIKQLVTEFNALAEKVPETIKKNYANPKLNPLNVDNGLYQR